MGLNFCLKKSDFLIFWYLNFPSLFYIEYVRKKLRQSAFFFFFNACCSPVLKQCKFFIFLSQNQEVFVSWQALGPVSWCLWSSLNLQKLWKEEFFTYSETEIVKLFKCTKTWRMFIVAKLKSLLSLQFMKTARKYL